MYRHALLLCAMSAIAAVACMASGPALSQVYVDMSYIGPETGTPDQPFVSVVTAVDAAKPGQTVYVKSGLYGGVRRIAKRLKLVKWAGIGPVIIDANNYRYGGNSSEIHGDNLFWFGNGSYTETIEGDVYLSDTTFQIAGPKMGQRIDLWKWGSSDAPTYDDDGYVRIDNLRHVDESDFSFIKYKDHVHYRFDLKAWTGHAGHLWFRISVRGRK